MSNYPSERSPAHCPLDSATFAAVMADVQRRDEQWARALAEYDALMATTEGQAMRQAARERVVAKQKAWW